MTRQIISDKRTRVRSIPFRGQWYAEAGIVSVVLENGQADGDLEAFADGSPAQIRIARPAKGDLIEARLTINAVTPAIGGNSLQIYVGDFDTDGITPLTLSSDEIKRRHAILTGFNAPFDYGSQDNVFIDGLNLMPLIPKRGETGFNEDAFIVGLDLVLKDFPSQWVLYTFKVDCTVQIAEVRK